MRMDTRFSSGNRWQAFLLCTVFAVAARSSAVSQTRDSSMLAITGTNDITQIQHIVFIIKENRSFDSYFGTFPGADGATTGLTSTGSSVSLRRTPDKTPQDIDHTWSAATTAMNGGKMDHFDLIFGGNNNGA